MMKEYDGQRKAGPAQCLCTAVRTWRCLVGEQPDAEEGSSSGHRTAEPEGSGSSAALVCAGDQHGARSVLSSPLEFPWRGFSSCSSSASIGGNVWLWRRSHACVPQGVWLGHSPKTQGWITAVFIVLHSDRSRLLPETQTGTFRH